VDQTALCLKVRGERLLARSPRPSRRELEELLTESCTRSYILEAQRLRTKRLMVSALADASPGPPTEAREELRELVGRYYSITEELERIEVVIARLRARLEKMQTT
jgi:sulfite reductase alpha subunit-like flavoprotein